MNFPVIVVSFLPANAMALFPFILIKRRFLKADERVLNHERIHLRQQLELLILPFYLLYLFNYLLNVFHYRKHFEAYENICFEREAYANDASPDFLKSRKFWNWLQYL